MEFSRFDIIKKNKTQEIQEVGLRFSDSQKESHKSFESRELLPEEIEDLKKMSEILYQNENKIGEGRTCFVYAFPETGICQKVMKPGNDAENQINEQSEIMDLMCEDREDAIVPVPFYTVKYSYIYEKDSVKKLQKREMLLMEKINGFNFEEIFDKNKPEAVLPQDFDFQLFKERITRFLDKMHNHYGVFHCDLMPRNIMFDRDTQKPAIIDFDVSRFKSNFSADEIRENKQFKGRLNDHKYLQDFLDSLEKHLTNV